jgi:hypothetical protein
MPKNTMGKKRAPLYARNKNKKERTRKAGSALYGENHLHMMRSL